MPDWVVALQIAPFNVNEDKAVATRVVQTKKAPAAIGPYSQGIIANGFLYTAGQIAIDPATGQVVSGGIAEQAQRVMHNLREILEAAGTSWSNVVKTTVFLHDMNDFPKVNEIYAAAIGDARPARSTVQVSALPRGVLVEIEAIAVLT